MTNTVTKSKVLHFFQKKVKIFLSSGFEIEYFRTSSKKQFYFFPNQNRMFQNPVEHSLFGSLLDDKFSNEVKNFHFLWISNRMFYSLLKIWDSVLFLKRLKISLFVLDSKQNILEFLRKTILFLPDFKQNALEPSRKFIISFLV